MTPHAATRISRENQRLFRRVEAMVAELPDVDLGRDEKGGRLLLSCHMLCRAISHVVGADERGASPARNGVHGGERNPAPRRGGRVLRVVDGKFGGSWQHSWLMTPDNQCVIDPYPPAMLGGPVLIDAAHAYFPGRVLYVEGPLGPLAPKFGAASFRRSVKAIERELRKLADGASGGERNPAPRRGLNSSEEEIKIQLGSIGL